MNVNDLNKLAAKAMKARLRGDEAAAKEIETQMNELKKTKGVSKTVIKEKKEEPKRVSDHHHRHHGHHGHHVSSHRSKRNRHSSSESDNNSSSDDIKRDSSSDSVDIPERSDSESESDSLKNEIIAPLDSQGRLLKSLVKNQDPSVSREDLRTGSKRGIKRVDFNDVPLDVNRYTKDDNKNMDQVFMKNIIKAGGRYKETHGSRSGRDEEEEQDMSLFIDKEDKLTEAKKKEYEMKEAVRAQRKWENTINNCLYCFENPKMPKDMLISLGNFTYLTLPTSMRVSPFHCQIVPMSHVWSFVEATEEVVDEIQRFIGALTQMAKAMDMGILFLEEARGSAGKRHCVIECIPVPKNVEEDAPIYFKKALTETDDEWQAANRKLIDVSKKGVRRSIPKGFPYFSVQWSNITGPAGGYVHIIEDESQFPQFFGLDIVNGMMGLPPMRMHREHNNPLESKQIVKTFLKKWRKFDWTSVLEGGEY
ncbi:hypothetical protein WA158_007172 [Blastocystis sp. Blastoise]